MALEAEKSKSMVWALCGFKSRLKWMCAKERKGNQTAKIARAVPGERH
jgi:hypothetical protein